MSYSAKKSGKNGFKVNFRFQGKEPFTRGVPKEEWSQLGFRSKMTLDEAKKRASQLNGINRLTKIEKKRNAIQTRLSAERLTQHVFLPEDLTTEFERLKLKLDKPKTRYYWACARRLITEVGLEPKEWCDSKEAFYRAIIKRAMSGTYIRAVLPLINEWGMFVSRKHGTFFLPVPYPKGGWLKDIKEAYRRKRTSTDPNVKKPGNKKSRPLTPEMLEGAHSKLTPENYSWLKRCVWFGLRAKEADSLSLPTSPETWWVEETDDGIAVLAVFQTKLYGQDDDDRIKYIPCFTKEQLDCLLELSKPAVRPSRKTVIKIFGPQITTHAGRKNFTKLMKKYGQDFQDVSQWLGHSDIQRTFQDYFEKRQVNVKKQEKKPT